MVLSNVLPFVTYQYQAVACSITPVLDCSIRVFLWTCMFRWAPAHPGPLLAIPLVLRYRVSGIDTHF